MSSGATHTRSRDIAAQKENRGIEAFSIPRALVARGAQRGLYTAIALRFEKRLTG